MNCSLSILEIFYGWIGQIPINITPLIIVFGRAVARGGPEEPRPPNSFGYTTTAFLPNGDSYSAFDVNRHLRNPPYITALRQCVRYTFRTLQDALSFDYVMIFICDCYKNFDNYRGLLRYHSIQTFLYITKGICFNQ